MLDVFRKWIDQVFHHEEAILLLVLLVVGMIIIITLGGILAPVIGSLILAYLMQGVSARLLHIGVPRGIAVTAAFTLFIGGFLAFLFIFLPLAWKQLSTLVNEIPAMISGLQTYLKILPERYPAIFSETQIQELIDISMAESGQIGQFLLSMSLASIPNVLAILIYLVLVPILVFFFLKDSDLILNWIGGFLPNERPLLRRVWDEMNQQIANYARGKALEILIVGGVSYIAFATWGLNYAALLALLVGLSVVIPYIGATVVTIPVALIALFQWGFGPEFLYLLLVYLIIQALDGNVLVPLLFSEAVDLHPVAIVLAVILFGGLWGLWGVFFAIPLATLVKAVLDAWPKQEAGLET
jgi:putative permease